MVETILGIVLVGAQIFKEERQRYYLNRIKHLKEKIQDVEDSPYYQKDMNKKGKAERQLILEVEALGAEFKGDLAELIKGKTA